MQRILSILLFLTIYITLCAQNLDNLPTEKRDSLLKAKSKEIILRYGPGYYREYKAPTIERIVVPPSETNPEGTNVGRAFYTIIYWKKTLLLKSKSGQTRENRHQFYSVVTTAISLIGKRLVIPKSNLLFLMCRVTGNNTLINKLSS